LKPRIVRRWPAGRMPLYWKRPGHGHGAHDRVRGNACRVSERLTGPRRGR
jgi:hypothetical protein